ncbi:CRP-like cAMP-binding protein [Hypnocyclicus thermotrophus]|uniref:CRP-like cAMP-binding protein n=1 Tax=Hypnocyclicus thermotrophus TaxID=1627895 RepID=A0AA46DX47_9FUSO|nr:Crp/Fnr family transcriptional regulator [Hypnocyclicus thermotrophus]TDT67866.1 CRP-like cAMP-binding protein [Hypnocyclicus thermotrophus]
MFENKKLIEKFGKNFNNGDIIFCEYEKQSKLYFIISGRVKITKIRKNEEKVLAYIGANQFIGEMAVFEDKPRTATIIAEEDTKVLEFDKDSFFEILKLAPDIAVSLVKVLSNRRYNTEKQLEIILEENSERKILRYIYEKYLNTRENEVILSLEEIKNITNLPLEEIEKYLKVYKDRGYLDLDYEKVYVRNLEWLKVRFSK